MKIQKPRYSAEETARRGDALYEKAIREQIEAGNEGRVVAIDVETGTYAVADTAVEAAHQLWEHQPQAQIWFVRVGDRALNRIGGYSPGTTS
jgi:hypothetical protein